MTLLHGDDLGTLSDFAKDNSMWSGSILFIAAACPSDVTPRAFNTLDPEDAPFGQKQVLSEICHDNMCSFGDLNGKVLEDNSTVANRFLLIDPGCFLELVSEHSYFDGDNCGLLREDRAYLIQQVGGFPKHPSKSTSKVFAIEDEEPDHDDDEEDIEEDQGTDAMYPDSPTPLAPLTNNQRVCVRNAHVNS